jgi:hypothetical protein
MVGIAFAVLFVGAAIPHLLKGRSTAPGES